MNITDDVWAFIQSHLGYSNDDNGGIQKKSKERGCTFKNI